MTIEDLIVAPRVADPQLSPDGRTVLFNLTTTDGKTGRRNADIWSVPADGSGEAKALIAGDRTENTPRWSPDGKRIAFLANRDGATQVYIADADGGNIRKLTTLAAGAQPPLVWSPDSSRVAFVSDVYPECPDEECNKKKREAAEQNPVKAHRLTRLLYRHWDEWRENIRHHVFVAAVADGRTRDLTPGDYDSPPTQQEDAAIAFSPDGRTVAFVSNREGNDKEAWTTNNDVWLVPVEGGQVRKLTNNPAADNHPLFSPDGRTVFVLAQRRAGFESDRWYLDAYDVTGGAKRTLFAKQDISVSDFTLSKDGDAIWFTAAQEGRDHLFTVPVADGSPKRVVQGGAISGVQPAAGFVVFAKSSLTAPPEVFRASADGANVKALTRANESWLKNVAFSEPESLSVTAAGGKIQVLADQAAELRCLKEISDRLPHSWRAAGSLGRRLVHALEPVALGGAGMGHRRTEPERLDRIRPGDGGSHLGRLGRARHDRDRWRRCGGLEDAVYRQRSHGHRRRKLRRLRGQLDPRAAADTVQGCDHA